MAGLEAQAEGGKTPKLEFCFNERLPAVCGVTQRPPFHLHPRLSLSEDI